MPRIFLTCPDDADTITISGEQARYLNRVLRCRPGDLITVINQNGTSLTASICDIARDSVTTKVAGRTAAADTSGCAITLYQSLLKGEKMDLVVQKSTELGISILVPVISERCIVRDTRKLPRWRKIAEEASRQSGRVHPPKISEPLRFDSIFKDPPSPAILFWEQGGDSLQDIAATLPSPPGIGIFTGPEGGFSEEEALRASDAGVLIASLGSRILRAETAAIAAVTLMQYIYGTLNSPGDWGR